MRYDAKAFLRERFARTVRGTVVRDWNNPPDIVIVVTPPAAGGADHAN